MGRIAVGILFASALLGVAWLLARGWSYYFTPLIERPRHPDYWLLKPGGTWGRMYGIVGAGLMVAMLSYTVRKRWGRLRQAGRLRSWLTFHIFCGVVGPLLIVLHSSFKVQGLVALSFWSMVAVALSGVLGRYLYLQIPRTRNGDALSLEAVEAMDARLVRHLREVIGLPEDSLERLDALGRRGTHAESGLLVLLLRLPIDGLALRWRLLRFRGELRRVPKKVRRRALALARRKAILTRRILLWSRLQSLFHYWHVIHKPFAVVMYFFMAVHIVVVSVAGYGW